METEKILMGQIIRRRDDMYKFLILICISLLLAGGPSALAQKGTPSPESQKVTPPSYPVVLGDQILFYVKDFREPSGKLLSGEERAKLITDRVKKAAEDPHIAVTSLGTSAYEQPMTLITAGDEMLMSVFDEDALAEGRTRQELATDYGQKLQTAIAEYRQKHSLKHRLTGLLYALIATAILIAILYLFKKLYRKGEARIQNWLNSKKVHIGIQTLEIVQAERIRVILIGAVKIIRVFIILLIFYTYFQVLLSFFPLTEAFARQVFNYILGPLQTIGSAVWGKIPGLIVLAIIILITVYFAKLLGLFFTGIEKGTITFEGFYPEWAKPTNKICRLLVIVFAAVIAFPYIPGSDSLAFKGISVFLGVIFSLGSTSFIANILAGYTLIYRRVFSIGDRVKIADFTGDVVDKKLQVTHLRTVKNEEIIVPNSMIVNSHVINYSSMAREKGLILHTTVTIGYDAPWRQVHAMLLMAAERTSGLLREPPPFIRQKSLDDFYVTYELNAYTDKPLEMDGFYSELHKNIQDAFNEYGVQIMSPAYESDPDRPKFVPKEKWYSPPAKPPDAPEKKS